MFFSWFLPFLFNLCEFFVYKEKTLISQQFINNNQNSYEENGRFPL